MLGTSKLDSLRRAVADAVLAGGVVVVWFAAASVYLGLTDDPGAIGKLSIVTGLVVTIFAALRLVRASAYDDGLDARRNEFDDVPF
jgi:hypothetical protein